MPGLHRLLDPCVQCASAGRCVSRQSWPQHQPHLKHLCSTVQLRSGALHRRDQLNQIDPDHTALAPSASISHSPNRQNCHRSSRRIRIVPSPALFRQASRSHTNISSRVSRGMHQSGSRTMSRRSGRSEGRLPEAAAKSYTVLSSSGHEHQNNQHKGIGRSAPPRHAGFGFLAPGRPAGFQKMQRPAKAAASHYEGHEDDMEMRRTWTEEKILWVGIWTWQMPIKPKQHCTIQIDPVGD